MKGHAHVQHVAKMSPLYVTSLNTSRRSTTSQNEGWVEEQTKSGVGLKTGTPTRKTNRSTGFDVVDFQPFQAFKASHVDLDTNHDVKLGHDALKGCTRRIQSKHATPRGPTDLKKKAVKPLAEELARYLGRRPFNTTKPAEESSRARSRSQARYPKGVSTHFAKSSEAALLGSGKESS